MPEPDRSYSLFRSAPSALLIPPLHEWPAVMQQVQIDQLLLELVASGVIEAGAHFGEQVVDVFLA